MILCDGNKYYGLGLGAYGVDSEHKREPERSRVTIQYIMYACVRSLGKG